MLNILYFIVAAAILIILLYFYLKFSIRKCVCKTSMGGKVVIITGASSGIGYYTALKLAAKGARTILACRSEQRGMSAQESIIAATGNRNVVFKQVDLLSLDSIRKFAKNILETEYRLDVLVNNAGACAFGANFTVDGFPEGMQVNYYGPFLLTMMLLPLLKKSQPSRIVNVSTLMYLFGCINFDTINKGACNRIIMYSNSKLCSLVFHQELSRRLVKSGVVVNSVHPGIILTNILSEGNFLFKLIFKFLCWFNSRTVDDGSQTVVHLAVAKESEKVTGKFYMDCKELFVLPKINNELVARDLWQISEKSVGYKACRF